jgi:benzoyl-CoA-dihydrodiol lyase
VSLPEVPLLGVLPGTGGLTRLVDKRRMRRDLADVFCTTSEGVRAERAKEWKLVDHIAKPQQFEEMVKARAAELAKLSDRPGGQGVALTPLKRTDRRERLPLPHVEVALDRAARTATLTVTAPMGRQPTSWRKSSPRARAGGRWPWRANSTTPSSCCAPTTSTSAWADQNARRHRAVLEADATMAKFKDNWFVRETIGMLRRCLRRLDVSSRSMFAVATRAPASAACSSSWRSPPTAASC